MRGLVVVVIRSYRLDTCGFECIAVPKLKYMVWAKSLKHMGEQDLLLQAETTYLRVASPHSAAAGDSICDCISSFCSAMFFQVRSKSCTAMYSQVLPCFLFFLQFANWTFHYVNYGHHPNC